MKLSYSKSFSAYIETISNISKISSKGPQLAINQYYFLNSEIIPSECTKTKFSTP